MLTTKWKNNLANNYHKNIVENPNRHIRISFRFQRHKSCMFSIKNFKLYGNQFTLTVLFTLTISKLNINTISDIILHLRVKWKTAITMCSTFALNCYYDRWNNEFFWERLPSEQSVFWETSRAQKYFFISLDRSDYQYCHECASTCEVSKIIF